MQSSEDLLGIDGPFSRLLYGFQPRLQQQELAMAIAEALNKREVLVAEAGTGTGKTFAYLVPAIASGEKVIVSTGTKMLQDQLVQRDLPKVRDALQSSCTFGLLKGRSNYFCLYRFDKQVASGRHSLHVQDQLHRLRYWQEHTRSGDISEVTDIPEDSSIWPLVTSTTDNCLGSDCPEYEACYVVAARKAAQQVDVLVINHHLYFADQVLKDEGFGELLPGVKAVIFDEAHQLAETAKQFFGQRISSRQISELARDSLVEILEAAPDQMQLRDQVDRLDKAVKEFRLSMGINPQRNPWTQVAAEGRVQEQLDHMVNCLSDLEQALEPLCERSVGVEHCWTRCQQFIAQLDRFEQQASELPQSEPPMEQQMDEAQIEGEHYVHWLESHKQGFVLHRSPTQIADVFGDSVKSREQAWIFTSATLTVNNRFDYFCQQLGLDPDHCVSWESPFDFQKQARLYLPKGLPMPAHNDYLPATAQAMLPVIEAVQGRTFVLSTSYRALNFFATFLRSRLDYPVLVQGESSKTELLNNFRELGNAVLVGTYSFWEGIDVRGQLLSCVIIDKLPFSTPDDPVLQASMEQMKRRGQNPFYQVQVPEAAIILKQGVGRLLRDSEDYGVLMICDPRLTSKSYGKIFLRSLPPIPVSRELQAVTEFFQTKEKQSAGDSAVLVEHSAR